MQVGHGLLQHIGKGLIGKRLAGQGRAIRTADGFQCAADHFGVFGKIAVEGKPVLRLGGVQPARVLLQNAVTLLQEDDVGDYFRPGVGLERIVGQANRPQQLRALRDVFRTLAVRLSMV